MQFQSPVGYFDKRISLSQFSLTCDGDKKGVGGLTGDSWRIISTSQISNSWECLNVEIAADTKTEL